MRVRWVWALLDLPEDRLAESVEFWRAVTRTTPSPWRGAQEEFATLRPQHGDAWVKVQRGGSRGVHVDLDVEGPLAPARDEAVALGAAVLSEHTGHDELDVVVCRSPGGFVFCLTRWHPEDTSVGQWREDQPSLLDQVCLDIPQSRYAAEVAFWSRLTGWAVEGDESSEFDRLEWPRELPIRFLLQRLDDRDGIVRAHVDLACADTAAEARRHVGLGATQVRPGRGWIVLRDPGGMEYCCTGRDPLTGGAAPA